MNVSLVSVHLFELLTPTPGFPVAFYLSLRNLSLFHILLDLSLSLHKKEHIKKSWMQFVFLDCTGSQEQKDKLENENI